MIPIRVKHAYKISILFSFAVFLNLSTYANGGPVDWSTVLKTGRIQLIKDKFVNIVREDLSVIIEDDYTYVKVKYAFKNMNVDKDTITYGFPVDIIQDAYEGDFNLNSNDLKDISFLLNGSKLPIKKHFDLGVNNLENQPYPLNMHYRRNWYLVDLIVLGNSDFDLIVEYKVKNYYIDHGISKSFFTSYDKRNFIYDLSPAFHWGDGDIKELNITADLSKINCHADSIKVMNFKNFKNQNGIYQAKFSNFKLNKISPFIIEYENKINKLSKDIAENDFTKKYLKSIESISNLKGNYEIKNLIDRDFNTAWAEGKEDSGLGEKIIINLNDCTINAICLINGYAKNEETFYNNNRIKKARIEFEFVKEGDLDDNYADELSKEFEFVEFADLPYKSVNKDNFAHLISIVADFGYLSMKMRKITLTILEVYKGKKFNDTCLSEIYLLGYDKED
ncbi:MAG: hypothetical protein RLZZ546_1872 [Bacteroidota bacterium]|jgi:hypothetical protein